MKMLLLNALALLFLVSFGVAVVAALGWKLWHGMKLLTEAISDIWSH